MTNLRRGGWGLSVFGGLKAGKTGAKAGRWNWRGRECGLRFAGRFWHAKHLYKDCAPKGGNCLQVWCGWKLLDLSRLVKVSWRRGLLFWDGVWGIGLQACRKAHSVVRSIFKMRLPWQAWGPDSRLRSLADESRLGSAFGQNQVLRQAAGAVKLGQVGLHLAIIAQGCECGVEDGRCCFAAGR